MHRTDTRGRAPCLTFGRNPRVGLDIDGVLRNIEPALDRVIKRRWPNAVEVKPTSWNFQDRYSGIDKSINGYIFGLCHKEVFQDSLPYDGAIEFANKLNKMVIKEKGKLVIVTKQSRPAQVSTLRWLADYKINVNELHMIKSHGSKVDAECDLLIDDYITNLTAQEEAYGGAICMARIWNTDWERARFETYDEILLEVEIQLKLFTSQLK